MHPVIQFLKDNTPNGFGLLQSVHGVKATRSTVYPELVNLNYDQIDAREDDELACLCRGLIVCDYGDGDYFIVAHPFPRFFNAGSSHAAPLNWDAPVVFEEKLDGTLCVVYYWKGDWRVATRGNPDANIPCADGLTFAQKFCRAAQVGSVWAALFNLFGREPYAEVTYCFELVGPDNQIVVPYENSRIVFLSAFAVNYSPQLPPATEMTEHFVRFILEMDRINPSRPSTLPDEYGFSSLNDAVDWLEENTTGLDLEGFVAVDSNGNRVKVKSKKYLTIARTISRITTQEDMLECIIRGIDDDVMAWVPESRRLEIESLKMKFSSWMAGLDKQLDEYQQNHAVVLSDKSSRKAYALWCQNNNIPMAPAMFPGTVREWIDSQKELKPSFLSQLLRYIGA